MDLVHRMLRETLSSTAGLKGIVLIIRRFL